MHTFRSQQQDYQRNPLPAIGCVAAKMNERGRVLSEKLGNWANDKTFKCIKVTNGNENVKRTKKYATEISVKETEETQDLQLSAAETRTHKLKHEACTHVCA